MIFEVPAGSVGEVATRIGVIAGITISVLDPEVARRRSPGVRGRFTLRAALQHALKGTSTEAEFLQAGVVRVVRSRVRSVAPRPTAAPVPTPEPNPQPDIIVTASKQRTTLDRYPGSVIIVDAGGGWSVRNASEGASAITRALPTVQSTDLGQGRDKLFIRGVADSSFRGQTQAATGQYLGDVRLTYSAPDPSLNLYDIQRVEVLIGPQAPLYGSGSLGGVIRLVPNSPDSSATAARIASNVASTRYGGIGRDFAAVVNTPLLDGRVAARVVVFDGRQAGYIDAPAQRRKDVNVTRSRGHRAVLRIAELAEWTIDVGHVLQKLRSADGQYAIRNAAPLTRDAAVQQPFLSDYRMTYVTARRDVGDAEIVSTTAVVDHHLDTTFDASPLFGPEASFSERNDIDLWSHETRLAGGGNREPWIVGVSGIQSTSRSRSALVSRGGAIEVEAVNRSFDSALFGRVTRSMGDAFTATIGGRLAFASATAQILRPLATRSPRFSRDALRVSRMAALGWVPSGTTSAYLRYEQGYRAGGLSVFPTEEGGVSQTYRPDTLDMVELGFRFGDERQDGLTARATLFSSVWRDVQADTATILGFTVTSNVGRGVIRGLDGEATWRMTPELTVRADVFVNDGFLSPSGPSPGSSTRERLPNVAKAGGRIGAVYKRPLRSDIVVQANAAARYVGSSRLGAGEALAISQGGFAVADAGMGIDVGRVSLGLQLDNVSDVRGNTFAYGNPFTAILRNQITPLRPRTLKLSVEVSF